MGFTLYMDGQFMGFYDTYKAAYIESMCYGDYHDFDIYEVQGA